MFKVMVNDVLRDAHEFGARMPIRFDEFETVWTMLEIELHYVSYDISQYLDGKESAFIENERDLEAAQEKVKHLTSFVNRVRVLADRLPGDPESLWKEV